jgi:hypothetical protein
MRIVIAAVLVMLLAGCNMAPASQSQLSKLQDQVAALSEQVQALNARTTTAASFDLQSKCAASAKMAFDALGWSQSKPVAGNTATFYSHFNPAMDKCFMVFQFNSLVSPYGETWILSDAVENVAYGTLTFNGDKVTTCEMTPTAETQRCASKQEFEKYLVHYMGTVPR